MKKYDRYSCVNCKFLKKDEEYPNEEHYKCVKCGYWFDTLEQADNNDNHNCLLPNYEGDEELPMYFEEKEQNKGTIEQKITSLKLERLNLLESVNIYGSNDASIDDRLKTIDEQIRKLERKQFKEAKSKIIYGRKDKVLLWTGRELKELEEK